MSPSKRRTACIRLLAEIDQLIAEAEDLASQPVLADDEIEYVVDMSTLPPDILPNGKD